MPADVKKVECLAGTIADVGRVASCAGNAAQEARRKAQDLRREAEKEERNSRQKLEQAKQMEKVAKQAHEAAKVAVLAAEAALAAALAAIPFSVGAVAAAQQALSGAKAAEEAACNAYKAAQVHRRIMEARYKRAQTCLLEAWAMEAKLVGDCSRHVAQMTQLSENASTRLRKAMGKLDDYQSIAAGGVDIKIPTATEKSKNVEQHNAEDAGQDSQDEKQETESDLFQRELEEYKDWAAFQTQSTVIGPLEIRERLNPSMEVLLGLMQHRYETKLRFRQQVNDFRERFKSKDPNTVEFVRIQSKKNMAGQLGEDIIREGLSPYAEEVSTQARQDLKDGSYTKIDISLKKLKQPMVFGKGEGMGVREGGSVAIEVKSGHEEYLRAQKPHIQKQVEGHDEYDVSLVIFSRDIKGMPHEGELREDIKESGSRAIGMLPRKDDLNEAVWRFLSEGVQND